MSKTRARGAPQAQRCIITRHCVYLLGPQLLRMRMHNAPFFIYVAPPAAALCSVAGMQLQTGCNA